MVEARLEKITIRSRAIRGNGLKNNRLLISQALLHQGKLIFYTHRKQIIFLRNERLSEEILYQSWYYFRIIVFIASTTSNGF